jgi:diaminopimelate decarboxylase
MSLEMPENKVTTGQDHVARLVHDRFGCAAGELLIGDVPIGQIAAAHETPLFVYDRAILEQNLQRLQNALTNRFDIFYSIKANPNQELLSFFIGRGCGLEVASGGELFQALQAGADPDRIIYAGPGKSNAELEYAVSTGIKEIHVESSCEVQRLNSIVDHGDSMAVGIRVNATSNLQGGAMRLGGKPTPFGFDESQIESAVKTIQEADNLELSCVHLCMGTQVLDSNVLLRQYRYALNLARRVHMMTSRPLRAIDFGGGFGIPYFSHESPLDLGELASGVADLLAEVESESLFADTEFIVEPGRFLVGEAGVYVARVLDVKVSHGTTFAILDGGMHHHLAASGNLGQTIKRNFPIAVLNKLGMPTTNEVNFVGPLCTPLDVLGRGVAVPDIEIGDLVGVFQSGAYARTSSPHGFLSHAAPPEILVEDHGFREIRRRGEHEDLMLDQRRHAHS